MQPPQAELPPSDGGDDEDATEDHQPRAHGEHHAERPELVEVAPREGRHEDARQSGQGHEQQSRQGGAGEQTSPRHLALEQESRGPPPQQRVGGELHHGPQRAAVGYAGQGPQQQRRDLDHEQPPEDPEQAAPQGADATAAGQLPGAEVHALERPREARRRGEGDHQPDDSGLGLALLPGQRHLAHRLHDVVAQPDHVADLPHQVLDPGVRHEGSDHHQHGDEGQQRLSPQGKRAVQELDPRQLGQHAPQRRHQVEHPGGLAP